MAENCSIQHVDCQTPHSTVFPLGGIEVRDCGAVRRPIRLTASVCAGESGLTVPKTFDSEYDSAMHVARMNSNSSAPLISTVAAAKLIGCTVQHVCKLLRDGDLAGEKWSERVWMVVRADAMRYAANRPSVGRPRKQV